MRERPRSKAGDSILDQRDTRLSSRKKPDASRRLKPDSARSPNEKPARLPLSSLFPHRTLEDPLARMTPPCRSCSRPYNEFLRSFEPLRVRIR